MHWRRRSGNAKSLSLDSFTHPDRGSQYLAIRYTESLDKASIEPSIGSVGDSYDSPRRSSGSQERLARRWDEREISEAIKDTPVVELKVRESNKLDPWILDWGLGMVRAYILLQTDVGAAGAVAAGAASVKGVKDAAAVAGPYDVILTVEAADIDALGRLVVSEVQALRGVRRTLTCPVIHL